MLNKRVFAKRIAAFSLAALFLCSTFAASTTETQSITTGHTTWAYLNGYDPCKAAIAGIASSRVLWFNDAVLVDNFNFGNAWIYVSENGAPDPRGRELAYVRSWNFDDPNGIVWNVTEYQYYGDADDDPVGVNTDGTDAQAEREGLPPNMQTDAWARERTTAQAWYTWAVRILEAPAQNLAVDIDDSSTLGLYNFVVLVDTCKFVRDRDGVADHTAGTHDDQFGATSDHEHETFLADVYLGGEPDDGGTYVDHDTEFDYTQRAGGGNEGHHNAPLTP